uniref:Uncharacterized protein n=1 Tax=Utricularia reniformis TaxID=192314 RepID=A0A1Y0B094_9LAMI|nr:hypothetical protein AEK19_MT0554 [Utricularia reniformis]ART30809.1 hypothetical protein AEK19_MT0554 [Utricularia reniformis]
MSGGRKITYHFLLLFKDNSFRFLTSNRKNRSFSLTASFTQSWWHRCLPYSLVDICYFLELKGLNSELCAVLMRDITTPGSGVPRGLL